MNAMILVLLCLAPNEWTPLVAAEGAVVSLEHKAQPAPLPDGAGARPVTGPLEVFGEVRQLIAKGNALADRGKAILDQAEREGKVTVDIRLPGRTASGPTASASRPCPGGTCPYVPQRPADKPAEKSAPAAGYESHYDTYRPRLLGRFRR